MEIANKGLLYTNSATLQIAKTSKLWQNIGVDLLGISYIIFHFEKIMNASSIVTEQIIASQVELIYK